MLTRLYSPASTRSRRRTAPSPELGDLLGSGGSPSLAPAGGEPPAPLLERRTTALLLDAAMLAVAVVVLALVSRTPSPTGGIPPEPLGWSIAFSITVLVSFALRGFYADRFRQQLLEELRLVVVGVAIAAATVIAARVLVENDSYAASQTVRHSLLAIALLVAGRIVLLKTQARRRALGVGSQPALIVGAGRVGNLVARRLLENPQVGLRPIGFLDNNPLELDGASANLPVLGSEKDFDRMASAHGVRHVIVTFSRAPHEVLLSIVRECWARGITVSLVPRLFEVEGERFTTRYLGGLPLIGVRPTSQRSWQFLVKHLFDRVGAAVLLVGALPLLTVIAMAVLATMGRPLLYRQRRVGRDGHVFSMLKFRTMTVSANNEPEADADWADEQLATGAPAAVAAVADRMTPVGWFLRRFGLDELPQLWNVLRGDMSLVGPRPERVGYAQRFGEHVYRYDDRHRVKAGITGWAQVHGLRGKTSLSDRVEWDNHYIENWSLWLDFKIFVMTLTALAQGRGR
jgi:exopolysaccharide biosynthesis polyprenyl glycosylphosphotransferase